MKRLICILSALLVCITLGAQAKIYTKKAKLEDFYSKTTMVVLGGDPLSDALLKEAVITRWRVSPYEFCSLEQYETLKTNPGYYFLSVASKADEPGMVFLSLSKGGSDGKVTELESAMDVVLLPLDREDFSAGRAHVYLGPFVDFVQSYTEDIRISEKNSVLGLSRYNKVVGTLRAPVYVGVDDLMPEVTSVPECFMALSSEEVDNHFVSGESCVALSFYPDVPGKGSKSYQLIISSDTHELLYYSVHPCYTLSSKGFSAKEIAFIAKRMGHADR